MRCRRPKLFPPHDGVVRSQRRLFRLLREGAVVVVISRWKRPLTFVELRPLTASPAVSAAPSNGEPRNAPAALAGFYRVDKRLLERMLRKGILRGGDVQQSGERILVLDVEID